MRFADHIPQVDDKIRLPIEDPLYQPGVNLFPVSAIPNDSELERRLDRSQLLNALADFSDQCRMGGKRDKNDENRKDEIFRPISFLENFPKISHNGL